MLRALAISDHEVQEADIFERRSISLREPWHGKKVEEEGKLMPEPGNPYPPNDDVERRSMRLDMAEARPLGFETQTFVHLPSSCNNVIGKHVLITVVTGGALTVLIWKLLPGAWSAMQTAGLLLLAAGFILWTVARFELGASFTAAARARKLVTHGLYSKIRNPIYIFGAWVIAGTVLMFGHPAWLLIFFVIVPLQVWRARNEAAVLEAKFGDEYRTYRASTWF